MTHLSPQQLVDVVEGNGQPDAVTHRERCAACRAAADQLRRSLALAADDRPPDPSPLFWEHFSARVGQAVREEAERSGRRTAWAWRWVPLSVVAAAAVVIALVVLPRPAWKDAGRAGDAVRGAVSPQESRGAAQGAAGSDDASWVLMNELSADLAAEDVSAVLPASPGAADRALGHLSETERKALEAIIRDEMARSPGAS